VTARCKAVLFDLYDTLITGDWSQQAELVARRLRVSHDRVVQAYSQLRDERDTGQLRDAAEVLKAVAARCTVDVDVGAIEDLVEAEAAMLGRAMKPYPDSWPTLSWLRSGGIKTAVVSNCSPSSRPVVEGLGLEALTDGVVLSFEVGESKPQPGIFRTALQMLGVTADEALMIDDRSDYLDGAAAIGISTVRIAREHSFGESTSGDAHRVISDFAGLRPLIGIA